jgi:hypothetical protein
MPRSARSFAALRPAMPPPITVAWRLASTRMGSSASSCPALATAAATSRVAFEVAASP